MPACIFIYHVLIKKAKMISYCLQGISQVLAVREENFGARKLSKGFIKQYLSHSFGIDVKISLGALNVLVPHHFFDLVNGPAKL